jgi:UDP:flavonoid glycosyltransferase YjiC (YdhE family)
MLGTRRCGRECPVKVLFSAWPGYGHLLPMVPLARAAQRAGHQVLVTTGPDLADVTRGSGLDFRPTGMTADEVHDQAPTDVSVTALPAAEQVAFAARYVFGPGALSRAIDLLDIVPAWQPDLIVHDTVELGAAIAAETFGVAHVTHGFAPMVPETADLVSAIGAYVEEADIPDPALDAFGAPYLDVSPPGLAHTTTEPWKDVRPLRPSAGEANGDLRPALAELPYDDTVYLTMGTVPNGSHEVFRPVLDACGRVGVNVVLTTGPRSDPERVAAGRQAILARGYVAQASVMPYCRAVVSHAGAGTMLGALCHGLPQLCLPRHTDQPMNTAALVPTGAALALNPAEVTPDAVEQSLRRLLEDPSYATNAGVLRDRIGSMPSPDNVLADLLA